jgi:pullulanase/glycogen debranching enzyme
LEIQIHCSINIKLFDLNTSDILAYTRATPEQTISVCLNFSNKSHQINLPEDMQASTLLYSTHKNIQTQSDSTTYQLQANEAIILRK